MPAAASQLRFQGHPRTCPACWRRFWPFARGEVKRTAWWVVFWPVRGRPRVWRSWALICGECQTIIGYEAPGVGCEVRHKFRWSQ